jgi:Zn-dependent peptidase ImmA (M78 family)
VVAILQHPERDAEQLLASSWAQGHSIPIPVDPIEIARRQGIKVFTAGLEPGVSGMLIKEIGSDPEIYLNGQDSYGRQRFTCAHELGHWMQRTAAGEESWSFVDKRSPIASMGIDRSEVYANQFAAALLMPAPVIRSIVPASSTQLAQQFQVSADAMTFRLKNLGLLP